MQKYCYFKYRLTILFHCSLCQNKGQEHSGQLHFDQEGQTVASDIYAQISLTAGSIIFAHGVRICLKKKTKKIKNSCCLNTLFYTEKPLAHMEKIYIQDTKTKVSKPISLWLLQH